MGGAAAHLLVVVRVADDDGLVGGRVREGVVATRAGWVCFSLREALHQWWEADLPPAPSAHEEGILSRSPVELKHIRARQGEYVTLIEHGAEERRAWPGRLEAATASVEGKVKLTGWDWDRNSALFRPYSALIPLIPRYSVRDWPVYRWRCVETLLLTGAIITI